MRLSAIADRIRYGLATPQDLEGLSRDDLVAIKSDSEKTHYRFAANLWAKADTGDDRTVVHDASDETVDSMGDVISVNGTKGGKGWQLASFKKNPVLLWAHDSKSLPLGQVVTAKKGKGQDGQKALVTKSRFHERDLFGDSPWGAHVEAVSRMVKAGAMPGASVGFLPVKMHFPESEAERVELGLGPWGALITEAELRELSIVPVPANSNAVAHKAAQADVLQKMIAEGFGDERWAKECEFLFPVTAEDALEKRRELRRRSIQVPDLSWIEEGPTEDEVLDQAELERKAAAYDALEGALHELEGGELVVKLDEDGRLLAIDADDWLEEADQDDAEETGSGELAAAFRGMARTNEALADSVDEIREVLQELRAGRLEQRTEAPDEVGEESADDFVADILAGTIEAERVAQARK